MITTEEIKKTSSEWYPIIYPRGEVKIIDPDGWDRSNWDYSWDEELITENEFMIRVWNSTCCGKISRN
jgi:hypothetical protein